MNPRAELRGKVLPPVPLAFRAQLYSREQRFYDPYSGLITYGPYKAVNVKILHLYPKTCHQVKNIQLFSTLSSIINNILDTFLKRAGCRAKIEEEYFNDIPKLASPNESERRKTLSDFISIIKRSSEDVILVPVLKGVVGVRRSEKVYTKLKALGLKHNFITQLYTEKILNAIKGIVSKRAKEDNAKLYNLSLNILAKAGGIPWALYNELEYDITIGLSWSIRRDIKMATGPTIKYYGVVHTFSSIGVWERFSSFICETKEEALINALKEALDYIFDEVEQTPKYNRVLVLLREPLKEKFAKNIIHYIQKNYGYDIDIVHVTTYMPIRLYDLSTRTYMAPRGLYFIETNRSAYLVTTGYSKYVKTTGIGVPKPIGIRIIATTDKQELQALIRSIQATYALTAMNWRSFWGSLRLPTPIHYSKLAARIFTLMEIEDIKDAFIRYKSSLYKPKIYEDRPWFI